MAKFRYQHIKSSVEGKAPTAAQIKTGEIGVNDYAGDEKLFIKNSAGEVVDFPRGYSQEVIDENERVTAEALNDLNSRKLDASAYTPTDLSNYYTKDETSGKTEIQDALDDKADTATTYTKTEVDARDLWVSGTGENAIVQKGGNDTASGKLSVAMGSGTTASGDYSVAEGLNTTASGSSSHAEGYSTTSSGDYSHAEGYSTTATSYASHAEGYSTTSSGIYSHAEGYNTTASGQSSHAEGQNTTASGDYSHSEGNGTSATTSYSHAEGQNTVASGRSSHAEGSYAKAGGNYSHAEGYNTIASGQSSHAEGQNTTASGDSSHAEGSSTTASGYNSHAEGSNTTAGGSYSHVEGHYTITLNESEHASGQYNVSNSASTTFGDSGNTLFSVGNGTASNARHNAFEIRQNGDIYLSDGTKLQDAIDITIDQVIDSGTSASTDAVSTSAVYGFVTSYTPSITVDQVLDNTTSASTNPVSSKAVYDAVTDNELVWTNAFVTLSGVVSSHTENTDIHVTAADKDNWDAKLDASAYTPTDLTNYYTKSETSGATEISTALAGKADTATTYTKTEVDERDLWVSGTGTNSVAQKGGNNTASGLYSHAEGNYTRASGQSSHAEGWTTTAGGDYSHAEGNNTTASGESSHAEGRWTKANGGYGSHAEGYYATASGTSSHAEGQWTRANGDYSHAEGYYTITLNDSEHASGQYNDSVSASTTFGNSGNTLFSVGNGTAENARHNAFEIRQNGDIYIISGGTDILLQESLGGTVDQVIDSGTSASTNAVSTSAVYEVIRDNEYIVSQALNDLESRKLDASAYTPTDLSNYYTKSETSGKTEISNALGSKSDTGHTHVIGDITNLQTTLDGKASTATTLAGYGITNAYTKSETSGATEISNALSGKVNTSDIISAITPSNSGSTAPIATKVVAENELVMANALNDLNNNKADKTEDLDGIKLKKITQSAYDALVQAGTVDANTLYFITD